MARGKLKCVWLGSPLTESPDNCFRFESEMLPSIKSALPVLLGVPSRREFAYLPEAVIGSAIPDLIVGVFHDEIPAPKKYVSNVEAHIVALIAQNGALPEMEVASRLHLSETGACRAMSRLKKSGMIRLQDTGNVTLAQDRWLGRVQVTAFEIKLRRWSDALEQAVSYLNFADRSYVVLDGAQVSPTERVIEKFRESTVGLLLQRRDCFETICAARQSICLTADKVIAVQKLCRAGVLNVCSSESGVNFPSLESVQPDMLVH